MDLRFGGFWKANMGGSAKIFFKVGSCVIVFQWVFMMDETLVKQGWYLIAKITLLVWLLGTFSRTSSLFNSLAFNKAALTTFLLYFLDKSIVDNSSSLIFRISTVLQILTSLSASE